MKRIYLIVFLVSFEFWLAFHQVYAYAGSPLVKNMIELSDQSGALFLGINTVSFIENDEYFGPIIQGHTLVGHHMHPYIWYNPSKYIQVTGGIFMRRDWADTHFFSKIYPTFSIQYQNQGLGFLIGTINNKPGYDLIQPLYNQERFLLRGPESGLQLQYRSMYTWIDLWLEWLSLLDKPTNKPEELGAGLAIQQTLWNHSRFKIVLPIQLFLYHLGGQGISIRDYSLLLGATGAQSHLLFDEYSWLKSINFENYAVFSRYLKDVVRPFKQGYAFYSQLNLKTAWLDIGLVYWQGYGFISENWGEPLYQSIAWSNQQVTYQEKDRQLLLMDFNYAYQLAEQMHISLHLVPYYDFKNNLLEHSAGLYITYNPMFPLTGNQLAND